MSRHSPNGMTRKHGGMGIDLVLVEFDAQDWRDPITDSPTITRDVYDGVHPIEEYVDL